MTAGPLRIEFDRLLAELEQAVLALGLTGARAGRCALLFAETTRDGVYSHGVRRFPRFVAQIRAGAIDPSGESACVLSSGALERWNGNAGPGNVHAWQAMDRAMTLARQHGIGSVALSNTNHWMRGGSYGWQAAEGGFVGLCWSNTMPNVPPWGGLECRLGNNPFVMAIPRAGGHVVLDMAVSQFSYGALDSYARRGEELPVPGGYDRQGKLSKDAAALLETGRVLPIGYWKGSGLALALDLIAALLAGGKSTSQIDTNPISGETGLSQLFIAIDLAGMGGETDARALIEGALAFMKDATQSDPAAPIRYPGERTLALRAENLALGVPVDPIIWNQIQELARGGGSPATTAVEPDPSAG